MAARPNLTGPLAGAQRGGHPSPIFRQSDCACAAPAEVPPELAGICRRVEREFERARLLTVLVKTMRPLVAKMQKLPTGLETAA